MIDTVGLCFPTIGPVPLKNTVSCLDSQILWVVLAVDSHINSHNSQNRPHPLSSKRPS